LVEERERERWGGGRGPSSSLEGGREGRDGREGREGGTEGEDDEEEEEEEEESVITQRMSIGR